PPTLDFSDGIRVRLGEEGSAPVMDVTVPGSALKCSGAASVTCRLADPKLWRPFGLDRLNISLPYKLVQRNNAGVLVQTAYLTLPADLGPVLELTIDAAGETYTDTAVLVGKRGHFTYTHTQAKP